MGIFEMFAVNTAEKIETVCQSRVSGAWGSFKDLGFGRSQIEVDGSRYLVSTDAHGWLVGKVGTRFIAADADLYQAAKMAVEA